MRIDRVEIDGFGRFHDAAWDLHPGLGVVLGANEAGKTTFLNAIRALLFGFDATRDGRTWYPATAGGRRGGRLVLLTDEDERWVVERHGERGGTGALAVRAPNGNQGGQETLDRLLHGADRDLFANVFAFGLGELQDLHTLSTAAVRGRIYGAGSGLGGASAVDIEKALRAGLRDRFVPTGSKPPLNELLARIESLRAEIAALEAQPEEHAAAHRERAALESRAAEHRTRGRALHERQSRLRNVRRAAPVLAELAEIERELANGNADHDALPPDVIADLDRIVTRAEAADLALIAIDEELAEARQAREAVRSDTAVLSCAESILAAREAIVGIDAMRLRRSDMVAAIAARGATVEEQLARAGGWTERRLLALDDSIPAVQATRDAEERLASARAEAAAAESRHAAARDELDHREREVGPTEDDPAEDDRRLAVKELQGMRGDAPHAGAAGSAALVVAVALAGSVLVGYLTANGFIGVLAGIAVGGLALLVRGRLDSPAAGTPDGRRRALLTRAGLPGDASDADVAHLADLLATSAARKMLAREQATSLDQRRREAARLGALSETAGAHRAAVEAEYAAWLAERQLPAGLAPAAAREMLAAASTARAAAAERDRLRAELEALDDEIADRTARIDDLLTRFEVPIPMDPDRRATAVVVLGERLDRAREAERRAAELDATVARLEERRRPAAEAAARQVRELAALLATHGAATPDALRTAAAAAATRRRLYDRARELRSNLAGIAGSTEAVRGLAADADTVDAAAVEAELLDVGSQLALLESEEAETHARIGALSARIEQLEAAEELGARRQDLAVAQATAEAMAREWSVRAVTLRLLEETRQRYERERQPDVVRAAESHFARFTGGRYTRIVAPPGDASVRVETEGGEAKVTDELSRGTAEQLYLALRFGLIEEFARHAEPLPVVMDDILVNFDAERAGRAAAAIRDLATRHQVLYFTCHPWTAELLDPDGGRTLALA
ncbi:MAG: AAA family ATPase [Chloroflexi bacterium]|nr:AAA family ATPase [Chloroflexota bacterium]